jgi:hypothetical protein
VALVKDLRTGKTAELVSIHDRAFGLLIDERQVSFYRPLQELEFLTPDPSLNQGGDALVGPSAPLEVVSHGAEADAARPLTALAVYWIGTVEPLHAIEGDFYFEPASDILSPGRLNIFSDGAFSLVNGGGGGGGGGANLSVTNRTATTLTVVSDSGTNAVLPAANGTQAGLLSATEQVKLAGIAAGAEVNVNADWTATSGDAEILNKPGTFAPSAHASNHGSGGSDPITVAQGQVTGLATALAGKENTGVAAAAVAAHEAAANPHAGVYTPAAHAGAGGAAHADAVASGASGFISGADQAKLNGIAAGAEVNVNADWTAVSGDAQILNKPPLGTAAALDVGTLANRVVQLDGSARLPAVDGSQLTNLPGGGVTDGDKGDITVSGTGTTWTIDNGAVTLAKQANVATATVFYRKTAGTGAPEVQDLATLKADLGLSGNNTGDQDLSAYLTSSAAASAYQPLDSDLTSIAALATTSYGRSQLALADAAADTAQLNPFTTTLKGLVPAPGTATGRVLSDSGSWVVLGGGGDALVANPLSQFASTTSDQLRGVISNGTGIGSLVFGTGPTITLPNATGLPLATGVTGILPTANGGTGVDNSTGGTANQFWARPNGATGAATYRAIVAADIPTLNQNTTGSAATLTTSRNIGGSSFNGSADVTSFPAPGAIGGTTPAAGTFTTLVAGSATSLLLGTAGSVVGDIGFRNATSGTITLGPPTGALGTVALTLPGTAGTLLVSDGPLNTPSSGTLTNCTGLPFAAGVSSKPTTLSGYGITDAQPLDSDLTSIAALTTTSFGRSFLDRADAAAGRTHLGLGDLATQSGTFSGASSGTNTGDQAVANTSDATSHTVTLSGSGGSVQFVEGSNITLTTTGSSSAGVVTIAATGGGGGYADDNYAIPANVLIPQATGPALATITTSTNGIKIGVADFDGTVAEVANFSDARPKNWDGTNPTAKFRWRAATGGTGAVTWSIAITAINEGDVVDVAPTWTSVSDAVVTAERDQLTAATAAIAIQGTLNADSRLQFWIRRNPADGGDTMSQDARLVETILTFALA